LPSSLISKGIGRSSNGHAPAGPWSPSCVRNQAAYAAAVTAVTAGPIDHAADAAAIKRGQYLVQSGGCGDCHTGDHGEFELRMETTAKASKE
jgi:hypothetical protein